MRRGRPRPAQGGAPLVMARDLATTPVTGITVQACGDDHLLNFGLFATPERNLSFGLNDFDEAYADQTEADWAAFSRARGSAPGDGGRGAGTNQRKGAEG